MSALKTQTTIFRRYNMAAASDYLENKLLDHSLATAAYTAPAAVYVGLHTGSPLDNNSGANEVSGGSYVRKGATFGAASAGSASTDATVTFDAATGNWGTITHIAVYDASSSGNLLYHGAVTTSKVIEIGDTFQISSGNLTISLD
jgi:hypothetical protein